MKTYFLHFNFKNLEFYFEKALICPANFYSENRGKDLQSQFENQLLLSDKKLSANSNCSLEIVVSDEEKKQIEEKKKEENYFLTELTFPISRVKSIFCDSSNPAFDEIVPKHLLATCPKEEIINEPKLTKPDSNSNQSDLTKKINKYDSFLGALAFMRLGGETPKNYSPNYFSALSFVNQFIGEEYEKATSQTLDESFKNALEFKGNWNIYSKDNIYKTKIDDELKKKVKKQNGIFNLQGSEDTKTLTFAILYNFYYSNRKETKDLFSEITNKNSIINKKLEGICFLYGYLKGYSNFSLNYFLQGKESSKRTVKFRLDSKLDYYTIESVYQYIFNNKKDNRNFELIDNLGFVSTLKPFYDPDNKIELKNYETFEILGKSVILSKKVKEELVEPVETTLQTILDGLLEIVKKWLPTFYEKIKDSIKDELTSIVKPVIEKLENKNVKLEQKIEEVEKEKTELRQNIEKSEKEIANLRQKLESSPQISNQVNVEAETQTNELEKNSNPSKENLQSEKVGTLRIKAKELGVKGTGGMKKSQLIKEIEKLVKEKPIQEKLL